MGLFHRHRQHRTGKQFALEVHAFGIAVEIRRTDLFLGAVLSVQLNLPVIIVQDILGHFALLFTNGTDLDVRCSEGQQHAQPVRQTGSTDTGIAAHAVTAGHLAGKALGQSISRFRRSKGHDHHQAEQQTEDSFHHSQPPSISYQQRQPHR